MINEPKTLYKLMVLHMLGQVNFPLTESQISDFFLSREYTNYFNLKQTLCELSSSMLISMETIHNSSRYTITDEGTRTLEFFEQNIPAGILDDIDDYLRANRFRMRNEISNTADYYKLSASEYIVHCEIREGKSILLGMDLSVPDEKAAEHMSTRWTGKSSDIYSFIMKALMSGDDT